MLCDRKPSARIKRKMYRSAVSPAMLYGIETLPVTERLVEKVELARLWMVRRSLGVTTVADPEKIFLWSQLQSHFKEKKNI